MYSKKEHDTLTKEFNKKADLLKTNKLGSQRELEDVWHNKKQGKYLGDAVFAANDGIITTFAVVAGVAGAGLSATIVIVLGIANLLADAASMGLGNFLGKKSERAYNRLQRKKENWEIDHIPEVEKEEIREIYKRKGFKGKDLDRAVEIITSDREVWVDTMMKEELNIHSDDNSSPGKHGTVTFISFAIAGILPLLPFIIPGNKIHGFSYSLLMTAIALFIVGALRSRITDRNAWLAGLEMLLVGGIAAVIAFVVGLLLSKII